MRPLGRELLNQLLQRGESVALGFRHNARKDDSAMLVVPLAR